MDTAQWPQEIKVKPPMEEMVPHTYSNPSLERKIRPQKEQALNCPRCNSTNTKFCYYNNYSLSQPRYFCKTCRRYWTEGGTLRSIPVGGGSRKNKRSSSSSSSPPPPPPPPPPPSSSSSKKFPDLVLVPPSTNYSQYSSSQQNPKIQEVQDLNLAFPSSHDFKTISELIQVPNFENNSKNHMIPSSSTSSAMELLTGISSRGLNPFITTPISDPNSTIYSSGFEFKPTLNFSLDHGLGRSSSGYGSTDLQETSGRLLFPFEDLKQQVSTTSGIEQNRDHDQGDSNGYWNIGMLGGGSW